MLDFIFTLLLIVVVPLLINVIVSPTFRKEAWAFIDFVSEIKRRFARNDTAHQELIRDYLVVYSEHGANSDEVKKFIGEHAKNKRFMSDVDFYNSLAEALKPKAKDAD